MVLIGATSLFIPAGRPFPNYETTLSTYPPSLSPLPIPKESLPSLMDLWNRPLQLGVLGV